MLPKYKNQGVFCLCDCDCGTKDVLVRSSNLRDNDSHTKSCGCLKRTSDFDFLTQLRYDDGLKIYCVYKHTSPSNKVYIGMTKMSMTERAGNGKGYRNSRYFYRAIQKYGWENIKHEILEKELTHDEACEREKYYISLYNSTNSNCGYNITSGGDGCVHNKYPFVQKYDNNIVNVFRSRNEAKNKFGFKTASGFISRITSNYQPEKYSFCEINSKEYEELKHIQNDFYIKDYMQMVHENIGKNISKTRNKQAVCQINKHTKEIVKTFDSIRDAGKEMNVSPRSISYACKGNGRLCLGYIWRFIDEIDKEYIEPTSHGCSKKICQLDINTKQILNTYESINQASLNTGINRSTITYTCKGKYKQAGGYIWRYADEVENIAV